MANHKGTELARQAMPAVVDALKALMTTGREETTRLRAAEDLMTLAAGEPSYLTMDTADTTSSGEASAS